MPKSYKYYECFQSAALLKKQHCCLSVAKLSVFYVDGSGICRSDGTSCFSFHGSSAQLNSSTKNSLLSAT